MRAGIASLAVVCLLFSFSCGVAQVEVKSLDHTQEMRSHVPPGYTAALRFAPGRAEGKYVIRDRSGRVLWVMGEGRQLLRAGQTTAESVFGRAVPFTRDSRQNIIVRIDGTLEFDGVRGRYTAVVSVEIFGKRGRHIAEAKDRAMTVYGRFDDEDAIYNVYAEALNGAFYKIFTTRSGLSELLRRIVPPERFSAHRDVDPTELFDIVATGTGFFVNRAGDIITTRHLVDECPQVYIDHGTRYVPAVITNLDGASDLAVLRAETTTEHHARFSSKRELQVGQEIITLGFPFTHGGNNSPVLSTGAVFELSDPTDSQELFQHSAAIKPGVGGGPVVDTGGNVIGVSIDALNTTNLAQLVGTGPGVRHRGNSLAIRGGHVRDFLIRSGVEHGFEDNSESMRSAAEIAAELGQYTTRVYCLE